VSPHVQLEVPDVGVRRLADRTRVLGLLGLFGARRGQRGNFVVWKVEIPSYRVKITQTYNAVLETLS
jgi:hypothetical protein